MVEMASGISPVLVLERNICLMFFSGMISAGKDLSGVVLRSNFSKASNWLNELGSDSILLLAKLISFKFFRFPMLLGKDLNSEEDPLK